MTSLRSHKDSVRDHGSPAKRTALRGLLRAVHCAALSLFVALAGCASINTQELFSKPAAEDTPDPKPLYRGQSPRTRHERQLQALIDHELAGTSVEERRRWMNELKYLDLTTARGVLQQRRQTLDRQKNESRASARKSKSKSKTKKTAGTILQTAGQFPKNPIPKYSAGTFGHAGTRRRPNRFNPPAAPPASRYTRPNSAMPYSQNAAVPPMASEEDHGLPMYPGASRTTRTPQPGLSRGSTPRRMLPISDRAAGPELAGPGLDGPKPSINPGQAQIIGSGNAGPARRPLPTDSSDNRAFPLFNDDQFSGPPAAAAPSTGDSAADSESAFFGGPDANEIPNANVPPGRDRSAANTNADTNGFSTEANGATESETTAPNLRNRFSRWGARLGFGAEDAAEQPQTATPAGPEFTNPPAVPSRTTAATPQNVQELIGSLEQNLGGQNSVIPTRPTERQEFIRQHVQLRLLHLMNKQPARAFEAIPGLPPAEQEFWQQMLWGLSDYFDIEGSPDRVSRITGTVEQLESAVQRLKQEAQLRIQNLNFCRKIDSYGSYERFRRDEFSPGQPILVYAEIDNFRTRAQTDGRFKTLLNSTIEIMQGSVDGRVVDTVKFKATEDFCRNRRRDYFHSYELTIPQDIGRGTHVLRLSVEDPFTQKVATETMTFTVR